MIARTARSDREIWSTTATLVVTDSLALTAAEKLLDADLLAVDQACSRFRTDSELAAVVRRPGQVQPISPILSELIEVALRMDSATGGLVDPSVAAAVIELGYDRDILALDARHATPTLSRPAPGTAGVRHDSVTGTLMVPVGVGLDLGATAKSWTADRVAGRIAANLGCGALVGIGGDIGVAGPAPEGGWQIAVGDDHRTAEGVPPAGSTPVQQVSIRTGGLATSSVAVRRWMTRDGERHHIVDPRTGTNPPARWRTVSCTAGTAVEANAAATAAIVLGPDAPQWLDEQGISARLVAVDGSIVTVNGWPRERAEAA